MRAHISIAFAGIVLASAVGTASVLSQATNLGAQQSQSSEVLAYRGSGRIDPMGGETSQLNA
jgi:hypothetical protein